MSDLNHSFTVSELNHHIRHCLEDGFSQIWVNGEISNFHHHPASGHMYYTLKDKKGEIRCAMFRSHTQFLKFKPTNGMEIRVLGDVTMYEARGQVQLKVVKMEEAGIGDLYKAFEAMKQSLAEEGLFDESVKKLIPPYPKKIGVITSGSGAAYRDIVNVLTRRAPHVQLHLISVQVQGEGASQQISKAIQRINLDSDIDVVILGRGGGSLEDLWAFNEENVARAIFASAIPIISAVGHETDFTIADFVADLRAPTPSAGAELASPALNDLLEKLDDYQERCLLSIQHQLRQHWMLNDQFEKRITSLKPQKRIQQQQEKLDQLSHQLNQLNLTSLTYRKDHTDHLLKQITNLGPSQVLHRGYAIPFNEAGEIIRQADQLDVGDSFVLKTASGSLGAKKTSHIP